LTDFRRVSDSLTISEAYKLLQKDEEPVSAENRSGSARPIGKN
jgi:hypothetical protein